MCIIGVNRRSVDAVADPECPVSVIMSFGSHLVVAHVVVTAIMSPDSPKAFRANER
jgi:hypothetical protein